MKSNLTLLAFLINLVALGQSLVGDYCFDKTTDCLDEHFTISSLDGVNVNGIHTRVIDYECNYNHTTASVSEFTGTIAGNQLNVEVSNSFEGYEENYNESYELYYCSDAIFIIIDEDAFRLHRCDKP